MNGELESELIEALTTLEPGDSIQFGELLPGLSEESMNWCLVSIEGEDYLFEIDYQGVYLRRMRLKIVPETGRLQVSTV